MHPSMFTTWLFALTLAGVAACGTEGPGPSEETSSEGHGAADATSQGGSQADGGAATTAPDDDGGTSSGSTSGGGGEPPDDDDGEPPPTCSIMSSNTSCKTCLEQNCCMVVHACLDEDLLGCVSCLDCYLSGHGPDCCDETVGKNDWLAECIAFNCEDAC